MSKTLPARPNLDHLRRQAKTLLAELEAQNPEAVSTILKHLPAAKGLTAGKILATRFRLADAQSAIARQSGFAAWPALARHVEQLRGLEGEWAFTRQEVDGNVLPASMLASSRLLIDGDRFRTETPGAVYEGVFNINVETQPHEIDIAFVEGPEAGRSNFGIFRLSGEELELCLDLNGASRPKEFRTAASSGRAFQTLRRASEARPTAVTGGTPPASRPAPMAEDIAAFAFVGSPTLLKLQGQWSPVEVVLNGQPLPAMMLGMGLRTAKKNEIRITFGGQTVIHALVRLNETTVPVQVDYYTLDGPMTGAVQRGIFKWAGENACFCMGAAGQPRPDDFTCPSGSERTLSQWRRKK